MTIMTITIFDAEGNVVLHEECEAPTASQQEIDDAVAMIEGGTITARDAMMLARTGRP